MLKKSTVTVFMNSLRMLLVSFAVWFASSLLGWLSLLASVAHASNLVSPPPLFNNLGTLHHQITTTSELAQRYFDQGLRLVYAFNHEEAILSFQEAARLDPQAAMAYWGIALALGPNINAAMAKADERRALEAIQKARTYAKTASAAQQAYIGALATRYISSRKASRSTLDKVYADSMRTVWLNHPEDPDAGTLFAEALMDLRPWDFWTSDGKPKPGTTEIVSVLEKVLSEHPDHPGAC